MKDKSMRLGQVLIYGEDEENCLNVFEQVKETLAIEVDTEVPGSCGIIW